MPHPAYCPAHPCAVHVQTHPEHMSGTKDSAGALSKAKTYTYIHTYIHTCKHTNTHSPIVYPPRPCTPPLPAPPPSSPPRHQPRLPTPLPPRRRRSIFYTVVVGHTFNDGANHQPPHSPHSRHRQSGPLSSRSPVPLPPSAALPKYICSSWHSPVSKVTSPSPTR